MRRTKGTLRDKTSTSGESGDGMNLRQLERRVEFQRWHDRGQAFCEHRLSGSRWSNQQNVMPAGNRDLQRAFGRHLSTDLFEVDTVVTNRSRRRSHLDRHRLRWIRFAQLSDEL